MKDLKINPTKIMVEDIPEVEATTKAGILLPNAVIKVPTMKGTVLLTGKGTPDIEIIYDIGDTVLYHPQAGSKLKLDEKELRLIDVSEIFLGGSA
jgi:co-chaperonin GroES (HSP10)